MRIAIIGAGGVGGYFGGRLIASGADVAFVARGSQLDALRSRGLTLFSPKGDLHLPPVAATEDPATVGPVDVVLFTVKMYDAESAAARLPALMGPETVVIPLQNGVDAVDILARAVGPAHVAGGTAYIASVVTEPGVIQHTSMDTLMFGELDRAVSDRLRRFHDACLAAGFQARLSEDITADIWSKFIRLTVFSGMTAVTRSPIGVVRGDPDLMAMAEAGWMEGMAVAHAKGVALGAGLMAEIRRMMETLPPHTKSSMLEDLDRGRRLELPWLSGAVVRIGGELGVPTPVHRFITAVLGPHVAGA